MVFLVEWSNGCWKCGFAVIAYFNIFLNAILSWDGQAEFSAVVTPVFSVCVCVCVHLFEIEIFCL